MAQIFATVCAIGALKAAFATPLDIVQRASYNAICAQIASSISSASDVIYPIDAITYEADISHWFLSSEQQSACVLEAGSAQDVSKAIKIIGSTKTPFAVYSGGHASNPDFSSTPGVQISFQKMTQVIVSSDKKTVEIGMGQNWANVYSTLENTGVIVVGGRVEGPAVGGFTLGGGYSWLTNQYGLTCDTVQSYNLVLPNGTMTIVDPSQKDLFFALKGGLNRFGIVTSIVYKAFPQTNEVFAGVRYYSSESTPAVLNATHAFLQTNTDPKAQIISTISGSGTGNSALVLFFYDGPSSPPAFDVFDGLKPIIDTVETQSYSNFVSGVPSHLVLNARGTFDTLSTSTLTPGFLNAINRELETYGKQMLTHSGTMGSMDIEPFLPTWGTHATDSAYPHSNSPLPLNLYFAWTSPSDDAYWYQAIHDIVTRLKAVAEAEGITDSAMTKYPNYSITNTTAAELYGPTNAARLAAIRKAVDPHNIMELAGGFNI